MKYKNVRNTGDLKCNCANWLDHWMQFTGSRVVPTCSVLGCGQKSIVGGHVKACDVEDLYRDLGIRLGSLYKIL